MTDIPSCCVFIDSRHRKADLLLVKAYVEERSRRVLFMGTHCYYYCCYTAVAAIHFSIYVVVPVA